MDTTEPTLQQEEEESDTYGLDHVPNCNLKCRFYENKFPEEGEFVMGEVIRVDQLTGAYVALLEYNNTEALIMSSEFTRKRTRSVHRLMKVGKKEVLMVTTVDEDRGFIDLSRKRVNPEDVKACEERYNSALKVHNIMRQTAAWLEEDLQSLYERLGWPLGKKFGTIYEAFMISLSEPETVFSAVEMDDKTKELLQQNISKRMKPMTCKVCADFEISWYTFEGIDAVKRALKESQDKLEDSKDMEVTIRLIKSPLYECATYTSKIQQGVDHINKLLKLIEDNIVESKGKFKIIHAATAIGAKEEEDIENMIKKMNQKQEDNESKNGEEDNEEGMYFDGDDETETTNKTEGEEDKKDDSDDEEL